MNPDASSYSQEGTVTPGSIHEFDPSARQGQHVFGNGSTMPGMEGQHSQNGFGPRQPSHGASAAPGMNAHRGTSPFDAYHMPAGVHQPGMPRAGNVGDNGKALAKVDSNGQPGSAQPQQQPLAPTNRAPSVSASPAPNVISNNQNSGRMTSSAGANPVPAIAPIGSRPVVNPSIAKRATTPIASPMTQSFTSNSANGLENAASNEKKDEKRGNTTPAPPASASTATTGGNGVSNAWAAGKGANIWGPPPKGGVTGGPPGNVWG